MRAKIGGCVCPEKASGLHHAKQAPVGAYVIVPWSRSVAFCFVFVFLRVGVGGEGFPCGARGDVTRLF